MQFLDEAKIYVKSGSGGHGCLSFRRERNLPFGGPNGGNGGRGGDVLLVANGSLNTLIDFRYQQHFKALNGRPGEGSDCDGHQGSDCVITIPVGTQVFEEDGETLIADLTEDGQQLLLLEGGRGGMGNTHFKSSTNRAPRKTTNGEPGEELTIWLRLKLLSDAGLVGLPNAGKSTFLAATSRARPKIADYPFTTLVPQLGVVYVDGKEFVLADLPGLIEGAHQGVGLGDRFLGHVERCGVLLHLVDGTSEDVAADFTTVREELVAYGHGLTDKPWLLALNKIDALDDEEIAEKSAALAAVSGVKVWHLSGAAKKGVELLLREMWRYIAEHRALTMPSVADNTQPANDHTDEEE
jgi:GTP-binding protein